MANVYDKMSKAENDVANYLESKGLWWKFEFPLFVYEKNERPRLWTPDFFLPTLGLYVEVCGSDKFDYDFRKEIYFQNGVPVIFLHYFKNPRKWKNHLKEGIEIIQKKRDEEVKKIME